MWIGSWRGTQEDIYYNGSKIWSNAKRSKRPSSVVIRTLRHKKYFGVRAIAIDDCTTSSRRTIEMLFSVNSRKQLSVLLVILIDSWEFSCLKVLFISLSMASTSLRNRIHQMQTNCIECLRHCCTVKHLYIPCSISANLDAHIALFWLSHQIIASAAHKGHWSSRRHTHWSEGMIEVRPFLLTHMWLKQFQSGGDSGKADME